MSFFKGLYAMKLAVIMNAHQLYQQSKKQKVESTLQIVYNQTYKNIDKQHNTQSIRSSTDLKKKTNALSKEQEEEQQIIHQFIQLIDEKLIKETAISSSSPQIIDESLSKHHIKLKSLSTDPNKLNITDLRNDLSKAIEASFKDPNCMKLLMWINVFLQINSKNKSLQNASSNEDDPSLLDRVPLGQNLLSFISQLSPFQKLNAPSDAFIAGKVYSTLQ